MAKGKKKKKGVMSRRLVPKWARQLKEWRDLSVRTAEEWIASQGGDRSLRDPGPEFSDDVMDLYEHMVPDGAMRLMEDPRNLEAAQVMGISPGTAAALKLAQEGLTLHGLLRWANLGMPAFVLDAETAGMLALTDVDRLDLEDVHFPFPTFFLILEPGSPVYLTDEKDPVRSLFVHVYEQEGKRRLSIQAQDIHGDQRDLTLAYPTKNGKVGKWVERVRGQYKEVAGGARASGMEHRSEDVVIHAIQTMVRLVVSFAMLFRTEGAEPKPPRLPVNTKRWDQSELPRPQDWVVAKLKMPEAVKRAVKEGTQAAGGIVTARHVVRGHWKPQAYGPGRTLRRVIRIDPYWRGAGPEALTKTVTSRRPRKKRTDNPSQRRATQRARLRRIMRSM